MEGIEARALKRSLCREISMGKSTQQALFDDIWCLNGGNGVAGEEFSVDDLLDLSDEQFEDVFNEEEEEEEEKDSVSVSSQDRVDDDNSNSSAGDLEAFPAVPVEEWKDLEWVSHFVDDSTSEFSLLYPAGAMKEKTGPVSENRWAWKVEPGSQRPPCFPATIPSKARSKRSRTATKVWSLRSPPSLSDSSITTSFSSSSSGTGTSSLSQTMEFLRSLGGPPAPAKKQKRKRAPSAAASGGAAAGSPAQRRCTHCQVQKTPQWRTGPLGAKTLCNACGVRFKSGRLFPEYRPACSPTFSMDIHSNSHRKVLEIRRKNETAAEVDSGFPEMVPSC